MSIRGYTIFILFFFPRNFILSIRGTLFLCFSFSQGFFSHLTLDYPCQTFVPLVFTVILCLLFLSCCYIFFLLIIWIYYYFLFFNEFIFSPYLGPNQVDPESFWIRYLNALAFNLSMYLYLSLLLIHTLYLLFYSFSQDFFIMLFGTLPC